MLLILISIPTISLLIYYYYIILIIVVSICAMPTIYYYISNKIYFIKILYYIGFITCLVIDIIYSLHRKAWKYIIFILLYIIIYPFIIFSFIIFIKNNPIIFLLFLG